MSNWTLQGLLEPSSRQLCSEMQRASLGLSWTAFEVLTDEGIDPNHLASLTGSGDIGRIRAEISGAIWNPIDRGGQQLLVLPVVDDGILIDIVAFSPKTPDNWALRKGDGRILGAEHLLGATDWNTGEFEVRIYASPMDWLAAGSVGICILSWDQSAVMQLVSFGPHVTLTTDNHQFAEYIEQRMRSVRIFPKVEIAGQSLILEAAE